MICVHTLTHIHNSKITVNKPYSQIYIDTPVVVWPPLVSSSTVSIEPVAIMGFEGKDTVRPATK